MALTQLTCPICLATLKPAQPVEEGTRIRCPKCKGAFVAEAERPPEEPAAEAALEEASPAEADAEEEAIQAAEAVDDDEAAKPRRKKRRRGYEEDEEERPRRKSRSKGGVPAWVWLAGGGVVLVLFCGCCGVGGWIMSSSVLGGNVSLANYNQIRRGMSEAQVRGIMGMPTETTNTAGMQVDTWKNGDNIIVVSFANGKAIVGRCHVTNGAGFVETQGALP